MPFIEINGANLYYETFGKPVPGQAPVVLIHGSTGTGRSNWSEVAPLLARDDYVIVPDCRGHGQSSNPHQSYSFKELAADVAALAPALGYPRAHVIGHSNGGNVAAVILLEHPDVVQTAILQAANVWVSPDLVEKEPPLFDPERVAREAPDWMNEMVALHGQVHGPDYWRDLLMMTVQEIISEPNYTPADLQAVRRPTLVIQGERDRVNAPYRHAQFIAQHVPEAELWIPAGIGHTVHAEILFPWIEKVRDFWLRRGDDDNDALYRLGRQRFGDGREWVYAVHARPSSQPEVEILRLTGQVLVAEQRQAVLDLFPGRPLADEIQVLLKESAPWALVNRAVADLRREPGRFSERVSQGLLGEALRVLAEEGEWALVRLENDGYLGWMRSNALHRCASTEVEAYQQSCTHLVACAVAPASLGPPEWLPAGKLPFGVAVPLIAREAGQAAVHLPSGVRWWLAEEYLLPISDRPRPDAQGFACALEYFQGFIGVPYLWGGRTPFGFDCSGLAQAFWRLIGVQLPRDADQQFKLGTPVTAPFQPSDLLFFGESDDDLLPGETGQLARQITHVAISLGSLHLLHSSGTPDQVAINSLDPDSPDYSPWLREHLVGARRYRC